MYIWTNGIFISSVQLEQTQKELDRVKELYIDVCATKEQLINEHKNEIKTLKNKYATMELQQKDVEKLESELQNQVKLCNKLTKECEDFRSKIIELEKDLVYERRKKEDHIKKIHLEIERGMYLIIARKISHMKSPNKCRKRSLF